MFGKIKLVNDGKPLFKRPPEQRHIQKEQMTREDSLPKSFGHVESSFVSKKHKKQQKAKSKDSHIKTDLSGSQFRILNELLYTNDSHSAGEYFAHNKEHYSLYHQGFAKQMEGWNFKPANQIISILKSKDLRGLKIVDLGCGDGRIEESLQNEGCKVRSYDLVAIKPFIIEADIAKLPLKSARQDYAIFSLSLMGTNYIEFVIEATRILKPGGTLIIAEVQSRSPDWKQFQHVVMSIGYDRVERIISKYFRILMFERSNTEAPTKNAVNKQYEHTGKTLLEISQQLLKPCIYKKR